VRIHQDDEIKHVFTPTKQLQFKKHFSLDKLWRGRERLGKHSRFV
jgi:hypothetical protein